MHCHHCGSAMQATESVVEGHACQTWYRCPLCDARQTVSQPCESMLQRLGHTLRCTSARFSASADHWSFGGRH
jgi:hypothetical protein